MYETKADVANVAEDLLNTANEVSDETGLQICNFKNVLKINMKYNMYSTIVSLL
jgi:hypothetical protein